LFKRFAASGRRAKAGATAADWLATNEAFYYVTPGMGEGLRWPWRDLTSVTIRRVRWRFARVVVALRSGEAIDVGMSRSAAKNLVTIAAHEIPDSPTAS
jgi:hypothetical protein